MILATLENLNTICLQIIESAYTVNNDAGDYFSFLYTTGSRPSDALRQNYPVTISNEITVLQPSKKNNTRTIQTSIIPLSLYYFYIGSHSNYGRRKYRTFLRIAQRFVGGNNYKVSSRNLDLYIFRYRYVRQLFADGMTIEQIQVHMGWRSINQAYNYINRPIQIN